MPIMASAGLPIYYGSISASISARKRASDSPTALRLLKRPCLPYGSH